MDYESVLPVMYSIGVNIHIKNANGVHRIISSKTRTGIRKIFWDTSAGKFAFSINQKPIFVQGANVVWARHFQHNSPYPDGIMHRWFDLWSSSGLNAVRIWGGGHIPAIVFMSSAIPLESWFGRILCFLELRIPRIQYF